MIKNGGYCFQIFISLFLASMIFTNDTLHLSDKCFFEKDDELDIFVQDLHPGAQRWFEFMMQKYPQAHLNRVHFCVSDNYEAGYNTIYFPEHRLKDMDKVFGHVLVAQITEQMLAEFAEDEYLLLHEAHHILNRDARKQDFVLRATILAIVALNAVALGQIFNQKKISMQILVDACAGNCTLVAIFYAYAQYQERQADKFANQNASQSALLAGIDWFKRLDTLLRYENIDIPNWCNDGYRLWQDPVHPLPLSRACRAAKAHKERFCHDDLSEADSFIIERCA